MTCPPFLGTEVNCEELEVWYINKTNDKFKNVNLSFLADTYFIMTNKTYILIPKLAVKKIRFNTLE